MCTSGGICAGMSGVQVVGHGEEEAGKVGLIGLGVGVLKFWVV